MKYITVVRGKLKAADEKQSQMVHNATIDKLSPMSKPMGGIGHRAYLGQQNHQEFLAVDTWDNLEGLQKLYSDPNLAAEFGKLFDGLPEVTIWAETDWSGW